MNISNPANPVEIAWYDTYPDNNNTNYEGCWGVYMFPSGLIIGSDRKYGLFILDPVLNPVQTIPHADFIAIPTTIEVGDTLGFVDFSSGLPDSWEWTVTGNQNFNSNLQNPSFIFSQIGQYSVKLRAGNSLGSDSIVKVDYINVTPPVLHPYSFTISGIQTLYTSPTDTGKVTYYWTLPTTAPGITYKFHAQKFGGTASRWLNSNSNGNDNSITLLKVISIRWREILA